MTLFTIKKILSIFVSLPGAIIMVLLVSGLARIRRDRIAPINIALALLLYALSIGPVSHAIIGLVEKTVIYRGDPKADVILYLGGGTINGVEDLSGEGTTNPFAAQRLLDTARLYNKYRLPVIVSGGSISGEVPEAAIVKRILSDLGIPAERIITEDKSMDTVENALYSKKIMERRGYRKGILVTSAIHLRRAEMIFRHAGIDVLPHAAGPFSGKAKRLTPYDFVPSVFPLQETTFALHEGVGLAFYAIKYYLLPGP
jgi:uncharacterized SAM-binding protein YcdF (DUF218 family)